MARDKEQETFGINLLLSLWTLWGIESSSSSVKGNLVYPAPFLGYTSKEWLRAKQDALWRSQSLALQHQEMGSKDSGPRQMSGSGPNTRMDQPSLSSASLPGSLGTILRAQGQTTKKGNGRGRGWSLTALSQGTEHWDWTCMYMGERLRGQGPDNSNFCHWTQSLQWTHLLCDPGSPLASLGRSPWCWCKSSILQSYQFQNIPCPCILASCSCCLQNPFSLCTLANPSFKV